MSYESLSTEAAKGKYAGNFNDTFNWKTGELIPGEPMNKPASKPKKYDKAFVAKAVNHWRGLTVAQMAIAVKVLDVDVELVKSWSKEKTRVDKNAKRKA